MESERRSRDTDAKRVEAALNRARQADKASAEASARATELQAIVDQSRSAETSSKLAELQREVVQADERTANLRSEFGRRLTEEADACRIEREKVASLKVELDRTGEQCTVAMQGYSSLAKRAEALDS